MANALYPKAKEGFLGADIDWAANDIKVVLVDTGAYTYDAAHDFLADIAAGARIATSGNLAGKSITNGVADADDVSITGVTGASVEALVIYQDTGVEATSRLIAYLDTGVTGLPFTPNGGNVAITWDSGANKIFAL
jgi:hypothetical protein